MERRLHTSKATSKCGTSDLDELCYKNKYQVGYRKTTLFQCEKTKYKTEKNTLFQCDKTKYQLRYRQITLFQYDKTKYKMGYRQKI